MNRTKKVPTINLKSENNNALPSITNILLGATEPMLKAISVLAAAEMLKQPQFALQVNQAGIIELSDILFRYISGTITIAPPQPTEPTFG